MPPELLQITVLYTKKEANYNSLANVKKAFVLLHILSLKSREVEDTMYCGLMRPPSQWLVTEGESKVASMLRCLPPYIHWRDCKTDSVLLWGSFRYHSIGKSDVLPETLTVNKTNILSVLLTTWRNVSRLAKVKYSCRMEHQHTLLNWSMNGLSGRTLSTSKTDWVIVQTSTW